MKAGDTTGVFRIPVRPATTAGMHSDYLSLEGPVERFEGRLVLRIPLEAGGQQLRQTVCTACPVEGKDLIVAVPDWLASRFRLAEGSAVHLDDRWGRLNITRVQ